MFKLKTDLRDIAATCERINNIVEECVIEEFIKWAKQDDEYLRANNGFFNHTGNLRSSLGAAVFSKGEIVFMTPFQTVLGGSKGSSEGRNAVERFKSETAGKIAKIMVAGMDYAQKVEDIESKDVMESRRIQCEQEARGVMDRAMNKAERMIRAL